MKYNAYPDVRNEHPELSGDELKIAAQLKLIENIQTELWGNAINNGQILKPMDAHLMVNWIGGGIFQYSRNGVIITSSFAFSLPDANAVADGGAKYSGLGIEYFIETHQNANWTVNLIINIAKYIYSKPSRILFEGMFIPESGGYIPSDSPSAGLALLCIKMHEFEMPDGRVDYLQLVPMTSEMVAEYKGLGDEKARVATSWYKERCDDYVFPG